MFCAKCGIKNDDSSRFCSGCGYKLNNLQPEEEQAEEQTEDVKSDVTNEFMFFKSENEDLSDVNDEKNDIEEAVENSQEVSEKDEVDNQDEISEQELLKNNDDNVAEALYNNVSEYNNNDISMQTENITEYNVQDSGKKFSVKRIIFSTLIIIMALASCVGIALDFISITTKETSDGETITNSDSSKGYDIITEGIDLGDEEISGAGKGLIESAEFTKTIAIILFGCLIIFAIIEIILVLTVKRRLAYVLTMLFSVVNLALSGLFIYSWCFKTLDELKEFIDFMSLISSSLIYNNLEIKITASIEIGMILILVCQAVIFVSSIVLMTCKNAKKEKMIYQQ